jgi:hypothetical protein
MIFPHFAEYEDIVLRRLKTLLPNVKLESEDLNHVYAKIKYMMGRSVIIGVACLFLAGCAYTRTTVSEYHSMVPYEEGVLLLRTDTDYLGGHATDKVAVLLQCVERDGEWGCETSFDLDIWAIHRVQSPRRLLEEQ